MKRKSPSNALLAKTMSHVASEIRRQEKSGDEFDKLGDNFYSGFSSRYKQILRQYYGQDIHYIIERGFPHTSDFNDYLLYLTFVLNVISRRSGIRVNDMVRAIRFAMPRFRQFLPWYEKALDSVLKYLDDIKESEDRLT